MTTQDVVAMGANRIGMQIRMEQSTRMTDFGMKATLMTSLRIYEATSRRSGRTETLLRSLPTDKPVVYVVSTDEEAKRITAILKDRKKTNVHVAVYDPRTLEKVRGSSVFFDHSVLREMYLRAIHHGEGEVTWTTGQPVNFQDNTPDGPPPAITWRDDI